MHSLLTILSNFAINLSTNEFTLIGSKANLIYKCTTLTKKRIDNNKLILSLSKTKIIRRLEQIKFAINKKYYA